MQNKRLFIQTDLKEIDNEKGVFEGYASTFGNMDQVQDIIEQGAFTESLKKRMPKVLWQHQMDKPVGKLLNIQEDSKGLYVKVKLITDTTLGKDAYTLMKEGVIDKLSIGFMIQDAEYDQEKNVRIIKQADLYEFSLVTIPANEEASITRIKSVPSNERDFEKFLRNSGYSRTESKAIAARGIKGYQDVLREADIDIPTNVQREADEELVKSLSNLLKTLKGK